MVSTSHLGNVNINGEVHAYGPVYVMGMDIKKEIEKIKSEIDDLKSRKPEEIESVVKVIIQKYKLTHKEKSELENALSTAIKITDWTQRVQFWIKTFKLFDNPFLLHIIISLLKMG